MHAIAPATTADRAVPANVFAETVTDVRHYTDTLFKFRITRPASLRFRSGEFVMIGLPGVPVFRAYSIASPMWDETLEFYSIKVPNGPLTEHLAKITPGDTVLMKKKPTGTLVIDALLPGRRLFLFATGTGIAPFASIVRDPETYEKFDEVVLTHTCRNSAELVYGEELVAECRDDPLVGEMVAGRLRAYHAATRETGRPGRRITDDLSDGALFEALGVPAIDPAEDRAMICGSIEMTRDVKALLEGVGLTEGANNRPSTFVLERAFVG